jgi:hypothetical protein
VKLTGVIWLRDIVDKLLSKHNVTTDEVEEVLGGKCRFRFIEKGKVEGGMTKKEKNAYSKE